MKNTVVTGCSSGFGYLTALTMARQGYKVWATMRDPDGRNKNKKHELEHIVSEENLQISVADLDVTSDGSFKQLRENVIQEDGKLDLLVNNAGFALLGISEAYSLDQVKAQFDTNFYGVVRATQAFLPLLRESTDGLIVNISSLAGRIVFPYFGFYCASKFALEAYSESLRYELKPLGVDVCLIEPGPYPTNPNITRIKEDHQEVVKSYGNLAGTPEAMLKAFEDFFNSDTAPDPQELPETILKLISTSRGERPLRSVIGIDYGVTELNEKVAPIQDNHVRNNLQMGHLI